MSYNEFIIIINNQNSTLQLKCEQLFIQKDMESSRMEKHVPWKVLE